MPFFSLLLVVPSFIINFKSQTANIFQTLALSYILVLIIVTCLCRHSISAIILSLYLRESGAAPFGGSKALTAILLLGFGC